LFHNRRQGNSNQQVIQSPLSQSPQPFQEREMVEANYEHNMNQRRAIGDFIAYASPKDFTSIVRPTMND